VVEVVDQQTIPQLLEQVVMVVAELDQQMILELQQLVELLTPEVVAVVELLVILDLRLDKQQLVDQE
jgi:hypothetical protein|tara:strand:+ start:1473 stop:1673 length:201 start_codon:yes stop_codon:yes gene_type:complete